MQKIKPDTESLSAYVDGELDKDDAADVARTIANDPVIARKVATLTGLRSALSECIDVPDLRIEDIAMAADAGISKSGSRHGYRKWLSIAACLAGLLIIGTSLHHDWNKQSVPKVWFAPILAAHDLWSLQDAGTETTSFQPVDYLSSELTRLIYLPDLTSAKLQIVYVNSRHRVDGVEFFVAGYAGTRGCKITLVAQSARGLLDETMHSIGNPDLRAVAWNAGLLDYVLMSQGMDDNRFELIAASVRQSSLNHQSIGSNTRVALSMSRNKSTPCVA